MYFSHKSSARTRVHTRTHTHTQTRLRKMASVQHHGPMESCALVLEATYLKKKITATLAQHIAIKREREIPSFYLDDPPFEQKFLTKIELQVSLRHHLFQQIS